jgi:hypothetical protein
LVNLREIDRKAFWEFCNTIRGRADIEHSLVQVCFSPIVLIKQLNSQGALVRLTRYDVGGTSISAKATIDELT